MLPWLRLVFGLQNAALVEARIWPSKCGLGRHLRSADGMWPKFRPAFWTRSNPRHVFLTRRSPKSAFCVGPCNRSFFDRLHTSPLAPSLLVSNLVVNGQFDSLCPYCNESTSLAIPHIILSKLFPLIRNRPSMAVRDRLQHKLW